MVDKKDKVLHALACQEWVSVLLASTTNLCEQARCIHGLSSVACAALGRALTMGTLLGAQMKDASESLAISIRGDGPLGGLNVDAFPGGMVRGYCLHPEVQLPLRADGKLDVGTAVGAGTLTMTRMGDNGQPYAGKVALQTGEIAEDFAYYFAASQQQPSLVSLGVLVEPQGQVLSSGGLLIQPFPGCPEEIIVQLEGLAGALSAPGRLFAQATPEEVLTRLFDKDFRILTQDEPAYVCSCSKESMEQALILLGKAELDKLAKEDNGAQLACRYCGNTYHFDAQRLNKLGACANKD